MSKMRVHELAKELAKESKEIINILKEQGIEKKTMSSVEDNEIALVKKALGIGVEEKTSEPQQEKKNITQVYNPQNSRNTKNDKNNGQNKGGAKDNKKPQDNTNKKQDNNKGNKNDKKDKSKEQNGQGKQVKQENKNNQQPKAAAKEKEETIKTITIPESLTIKELADKIKVPPAALVKKLFMQGTMVTVNQEIDFDMAEEIALEYNVICEPEEKVDVIAELLKE